jgi:hypothetical protein
LTLAFDSESLRLLCEDEDIAIVRLGADVSSKLHARLADLSAAKEINELLAGKPAINEDNLNEYKIELSNVWRLIFCSNHVKPPLDKKDNIDWSHVTRIKILRIQNLHESIN